MSKNSQIKFYYELGVTQNGKLIEEYVTDLPIIRKGEVMYERFVDFIKKLHGDNILILWNKKTGSLPKDNRLRIDIEVPAEVELKYNKDANGAIEQIRNRDYPERLEHYKDNILLIGINYEKDLPNTDPKFKHHSCAIEKA